MSEGERTHTLEQLTEAFGSLYVELVVARRHAPTRHLDSPSWRRQGENRRRWTVTTRPEAIYPVTTSNGHEGPLGLVGEQAVGTDVNDRHSAFATLARKTKRPQPDGWAHLLRDARELAEFLGAEGAGVPPLLQAIYPESRQVAG